MNDAADWHTQNDEYLAASLEWLRLKLARLAASNATESPPRRRCRLFFRQRTRADLSTRRVSRSQLQRAAAARAAAEQVEPPPALTLLAHRFGDGPNQPMSAFERDVLLLCAANELDTRIPALCAAAQGDANKPYPTFALAMSLLDDPDWSVLSPERPLRYWRLIEIHQPAAQPLMSGALRADERIVNYIKGMNYLDDRLAPLLTRFDLPASETELPPSQEQVAAGTLEQFARRSPDALPPIVQLVGADPLSKRLVAIHVARRLGVDLFRLPADVLARHASEIDTLVRLWLRDTLLLPVGLYVEAHEADGDGPGDGEAAAVHRLLDRMQGIVFLSTRDAWPRLGTNRLIVDVAKPLSAEQAAAWSAVLGDETSTPQLLAGQYHLNLPTIFQLAAAAGVAGVEPRGTGGEPPELAKETTPLHPLHAKLWEACRSRTRPQLDSLAQRIDAKATFDDIVLPQTQRDLLWAIVGQARHRTTVYDQWGFRKIMNRGLGINALFAGDSGTGKTMAAEVIANQLQLNLYRIDLSAVVSKYIGETEKNLGRLFDAAEESGAILFFDEADALFGKRSEVRDSHDRYANIEINYLLQRMESYAGLAILATNMKNSLDQAFLRRLRFVVDFPFPTAAERAEIWRKSFPRPMPRLDYDRLARLSLTGGSIRNITLGSAFLAAEQGLTEVDMPLVLQAARMELLKLNRPINEADFRWTEPAREVA